MDAHRGKMHTNISSFCLSSRPCVILRRCTGNQFSGTNRLAAHARLTRNKRPTLGVVLSAPPPGIQVNFDAPRETFDALQRTLSSFLTGTEALTQLHWAQAQHTSLVLMFFLPTAPKINSFSYKVETGRTCRTMKCDRFTLFCTSE